MRLAVALVSLLAAAALAWPARDLPGSDASWLGLIAPFAPGMHIGNGFLLSAPRYGFQNDVVFVARRENAELQDPGGYVEVHFVGRNDFLQPWKEKSARFAAYFECPKTGATAAEIDEIVSQLAGAVRANDPPKNQGEHIKADAVPLGEDVSSSTWARALAGLFGTRGALFGAFLSASVLLVGSLPGGALWAALLAFAIGLFLRAASLDTPLATAAQIGVVLDTHMPLHWLFDVPATPYRLQPAYATLLHAVQRFSQTASVVRLPSVLAGAMTAGLIVCAPWLARRKLGLAGAFAAFLVATSAGSILRSRELSEISLFGLVAVLAVLGILQAARKPDRTALVLVAVATPTALLLYVSSLGAFLIAGCALPLIATKRLGRRGLGAIAVGLVAGAPPLVLGLIRIEEKARTDASVIALFDVALHPHLVLACARAAAAAAISGIGWPLLALALVAAVVAAARKDVLALVPLAGALATFAGLAVMTPVARLTPDHVAVLAPLLALCIALALAPPTVSTPTSSSPSPIHAEPLASVTAGPATGAGPGRTLALGLALITVAGAFTARSLGSTTPTYIAGKLGLLVEAAHWLAHEPMRVGIIDPAAGMPLAYYLAAETGTPIDWWRLRRVGNIVQSTGLDTEILLLQPSPEITREVDLRAHKDLIAAVAASGLLVLGDNAFHLPFVNRRLDECRPIYQSLTGRMVYCPIPKGQAGAPL